MVMEKYTIKKDFERYLHKCQAANKAIRMLTIKGKMLASKKAKGYINKLKNEKQIN